ncbi:hypothetical protein CONLIGDRAFT_229457 [Coniochaeta ligniaria NRRL 30616]|uniref:DNA replication factor Cdt1 C-terminal domain-containing protein n=1 Tax=Coniochaeta ligniaria NRRL 30616 TaxID=1408157 RepID=A0A1J7IWL4_9PEZI|nr:hypothetical protein CONLIGDRAFT_229457 [Coniochaeta ligniaria NRRL 30616]
MPGTVSRQPRARRGKAVQPSKATSTSITCFARVSKVQSVSKDVAQKVSAIEASGSSIEVVLSRKRKADNVLDSQEISTAGNVSKKLRQEEARASTLRIAPLKRRKAAVSDDKENIVPVRATIEKFLLPASTVALSTSTHSTQKRRRTSDANSEPAALLERLNIQSSPARKRTRFTSTQTRETLEQLPQELLDLLSLHTALLKSLTLQYAHNGSNVPVDIRSICPGVAQSWGKRKVTSEDIQRCVGVLGWASDNHTSSPFILCDYGRNKLCIELSPEASLGHFDEERLNKTFESNLRSLWSLRKDSDTRTFISTLPKATMTTRASAVPLLVKGRNAFDALKSDLAKRQAEKEARSQALPVLNADGTKMSLLDRIKHKELAQSQSAAPPSPAELQRRAALQRAEDVAGVIGMLTMATAEGRARISFTMPALLVKLKDSLRTPVSLEDGACCVRLLAAEIAPEWLRIVTIGGKENVVIQCAMQPAKAVVGQRVGALLA